MNTPRPKTIFVDVDDTLVRSVGQTRIPMAAVIAHIRRLHDAGYLLYLWSSGGADYARASAVPKPFCPNRKPISTTKPLPIGASAAISCQPIAAKSNNLLLSPPFSHN